MPAYNSEPAQAPKPPRIVVAGGGAAGWICAAVLARFMPPPAAHITLVESDAIGIIGVGEATVPLIGELNSLLGIHEPDFVAATNGTFKLGIEFVGWGEASNRHFHGFGDFGAEIAGIPAHHAWLRMAEHKQPPPMDEWSMAWAAAGRDRFAPPQAMRGEAAQFRHAYHFDAALYAAYLRRHAEAGGVQRVEGRIVDIERDPGSDDLAALRLDGDRRIEGDLFLDCTGFASLLLGGAMGVAFEDWSQWLPCDRAVAVPSTRAGRLTPFTRSSAKAAGWQWRIPLQNRTGNGHVYASRFLSDDEACHTLLEGLDGQALAEPRTLQFVPGRRARMWQGNVVAIGLAAGFLEPLESTAIQLIQTGIARLIELFPIQAMAATDRAALADEYNRLTSLEYERIRDFLIAHYCRSRREEPFWRHMAGMPLPETLVHKLAVWDASGRIPMFEAESHREASWVSVLLGQGVRPRHHDPRIDAIAYDTLASTMDQRRSVLAAAAQRMPDHARFIERACPARA